MQAVVEKVSTKQHGVKLYGRWFDWESVDPPRVGDLIKYEVEGKRITYAELVMAAPAKPQASVAGPLPATVGPTPPPTSPMLPPAQDLKELRIVRENVLARAVELEIAGKLGVDGDTRTTSERLFAAAEQLEKWVGRGN